MLLQPSATAADLSIARFLFPRLIGFVTDTNPDDPENARTLIAHGLCQYVGTVDKSRLVAAMSLVIPMLMARATAEGDEVYRETSARLLELAAVDQAAFRAVVGGMSDGQKTFLEEVIRSGRQTTEQADKADSGAAGQPSIALKMDFGG